MKKWAEIHLEKLAQSIFSIIVSSANDLSRLDFTNIIGSILGEQFFICHRPFVKSVKNHNSGNCGMMRESDDGSLGCH